MPMYTIELRAAYDIEASDKDEAIDKAMQQFTDDVIDKLEDAGMETADFGLHYEVIDVRE